MRLPAILVVLITVTFSTMCRADEAQASQQEGVDMQKNPVVFWELASHDAEKSVEFLTKVFDWELSYDEESTIYYMPAGELNDKILCSVRIEQLFNHTG